MMRASSLLHRLSPSRLLLLAVALLALAVFLVGEGATPAQAQSSRCADLGFPEPTGELATPVRNLQVYEGRGLLAVHWDSPDYSAVPLPRNALRRIAHNPDFQVFNGVYAVEYTASASVAANAARGTDPATEWVQPSYSASVQGSIFIRGLTNGTAYRVRVRPAEVRTQFTDGTATDWCGNQTTPWAVSSAATPSVPTVEIVSATPNPVTEGEDVTITFRRSRAFSTNQFITPPDRQRSLLVNLTGTSGDYYFPKGPTVLFPTTALTVTETIRTTRDDDADNDEFTISFASDFGAMGVMAPGSTTSITITVTDADSPQTESPNSPLLVGNSEHGPLIAQMREWRNDPQWVSYKSHTDRWDRALLAFGEEVADQTLTPMTAAEAQELADTSWGTRWVPVAKALQEIEARPTAVSLAVAGGAARVNENAGEVTLTATLDAPAPEGGIGGFLLAGEDGTASQDIDFTMPFEIFIPGGQRSATATVSITDDNLDEADETVVISVLFDVGTALLEDKTTLTITDDDTSGVTVSAANPLAVNEGGTAGYTVVLDSQPTADVTITASSGDAGAATVSPASHTFTSLNWSTAATFTVSGVADADSNDETVAVTHQVTTQDSRYDNLAVAAVRVQVSDTTAPGQQGQDPPNQAPTVASAIADATFVNQSGTKEVSLSGTFSDADNDALTITAEPSNQAVATVSVAADYSTLTVTAKSRGTATVTVAASDGRGGTVSDAFTVKVKAVPVVASALGDASMEEGDTEDLSLSDVFSDADGDTLTISAASSDDSLVGAFAFQGTLTVAAFSAGSATITVTAQDSDGNTVSDEFSVTVTAPQQQQPPPNQVPTVSSALADAAIVNESGTRQVSLSGVFDDADGDSLTITAVSSNDAVATVSVAADYASLTVSAQTSGTATITVTADDGNGGTVSDSFAIRVKSAPVVASAISNVFGLEAGSSRDVSLSGVFSDADGDVLTITASSSDDAKATVTVAADQSKLTLTGVAEGAATITVTARDSDGNTVSDTFDVSVEPEPEQDPPPESSDESPTVVSPLPDISLEGAEHREFDLSAVFQDPDGDELTFSAKSSNYGVATTLHVNGSTLTVVATGNGTATITVTAEDPDGNQVSDAFEVTVTPGS